ncbi:MAG: ferredoxin [Desulfurococcales archaeon ex4484_217_2]|nr:MAG: ferredoxin [Desulfurococcales archaeon ex4484_217_2]
MVEEKLEAPDTTPSGAIHLEDLEKWDKLPPKEILEKQATVIIECLEEIPCDVCAAVCPFKAIEMPRISDNPKVIFERCPGCAICVQACPGLAIRVVRYKYIGDNSMVILPYELLPLPKVGDIVDLLDRLGRKIGEGKVVSVAPRTKYKTPLVGVSVPRKLALEVRYIRVKKK